MRIVQFLSFLPLGTAINRVPPTFFKVGVVDRTLRRFPQFKSVACY